MVFLQDKIRDLVEKTVQAAAPGFSGKIKIEYPADFSHGDFATAVAFEISKLEKKSPREVAESLAKAMELPAWISKAEVAGAGFVNFFLAPEFLTEFLGEIHKAGPAWGLCEKEKGRTVVTDTSHPNVAKPMGVHHLLSTIIGNSLNRILAAVGYRVIRDNYLGDWGTQFGKLIYAYKMWGDEKVVKRDPIPELLKLYVKFHDEVERETAEKKPAVLEEAGRAEFKKLEEGDMENRKLWERVVDLSLQEFHTIWKRLDVSFDFIHGESFYEDKMAEIIEMGVARKIFVKGEGGALIAPLRDPNMPPCIIKKSDGATLYATRDLARTKYWEDTWHPNLMVMVVDSAQTLHFRQFFEVAEKLKITDAQNVHVIFGRMSFPEKRMSTRKGNIILMEEVLDEAEERAYEIVKEKNPDLKEEVKREVARQVGIGAVKYAVLAQNRLTDVTFTWDKILSLDGNSAPYLQYAHARARSILRKAGREVGGGSAYVLKETQELALAHLLPKFPEVVYFAAQEFKPNLIANYLYELAGRFSSFYATSPVIDATQGVRSARLALTEAVALTLKNGLNLLGIQVPDEM